MFRAFPAPFYSLFVLNPQIQNNPAHASLIAILKNKNVAWFVKNITFRHETSLKFGSSNSLRLK